MHNLIDVQNVVKKYQLGEREVTALNGVSLAVRAGEFVILQGRSGSGKSTLLNLIGCVDVPSDGAVQVMSLTTSQLDDRTLSRLRREKMGFIFQTFNLIPVLTASENVEYPLLKSKLPVAQRAERVRDLMAQVGLTEVAEHRPNQLSGGQRQRVAIARALVHRPELIIADEPTANLDSATGEEVVKILVNLCKSTGVAIVMASHDLSIAHWATRIIKISDGKIVP